jgi:hypothetical protein
VKEPANKSSYGRLNTFAAAAGQAASKHIKNSGTRSHSQKDSGGEKNEKTMIVEHREIVGIDKEGVNDGAPR